MTTLGAFAKYIRSKNAGPFWMTIDIFFETKEDFEKIVGLNVITPELISKLFGTPTEQARIYLCEKINTIKVSLPRPAIQGSLCDRDIHAGQQYVLLSSLEVAIEEKRG